MAAAARLLLVVGMVLCAETLAEERSVFTDPEDGALDGPTIKSQLEQLRDVDTGGITAPLTFTPDNHQGHRSLRLYQVVDGRWTPITGMLAAPMP